MKGEEPHVPSSGADSTLSGTLIFLQSEVGRFTMHLRGQTWIKLGDTSLMKKVGRMKTFGNSKLGRKSTIR